MNGPFPEDSAERKTFPVFSGLMAYFPAALAAVAHHSYIGNEKHNPGQPIHWARGKSDDHLDAAGRHMIEGDLVGAAWRILAALQLQLEADGAPLARGAREGGVWTAEQLRDLHHVFEVLEFGERCNTGTRTTPATDTGD